jgi:hypothetical protein
MKRLTLLILSIVFALNVNAQIGITTQPEKFKTLKSSEKELLYLLICFPKKHMKK